MKIIQVASGCSMSSASYGLIREFFQSQGHVLQGKGEFFKSHKNALFVDGMSERDLVMATVLHSEHFIGKLSYQVLDLAQKWSLGSVRQIFEKALHPESMTPNLFDELRRAGCSFIHTFRKNSLDVALCQVRDFSPVSRNYRDRLVATGILPDQNFGTWRKSDARKGFVFQDPLTIVAKAVKHKKQLAVVCRRLSQQGSVIEIPSDELLAVQWAADAETFEGAASALRRVLLQVNLKCDETKLVSFLQSYRSTRSAPAPHSAVVFEKHTNAEFQQAVFDAGLGDFWRD